MKPVSIGQIKGVRKTTVHYRLYQTVQLGMMPRLLNWIHMDPYKVTLLELYHHRKHKFYTASAKWTFVLWKRLFHPIFIGLMMFLAVLLMDFHKRLGIGRSVFIGILLGFFLYTLNDFLASISMVCNIHPFFTVVLPLLCLAFVLLGVVYYRNKENRVT